MAALRGLYLFLQSLLLQLRWLILFTCFTIISALPLKSILLAGIDHLLVLCRYSYSSQWVPIPTFEIPARNSIIAFDLFQGWKLLSEFLILAVHSWPSSNSPVLRLWASSWCCANLKNLIDIFRRYSSFSSMSDIVRSAWTINSLGSLGSTVAQIVVWIWTSYSTILLNSWTISSRILSKGVYRILL